MLPIFSRNSQLLTKWVKLCQTVNMKALSLVGSRISCATLVLPGSAGVTILDPDLALSGTTKGHTMFSSLDFFAGSSFFSAFRSFLDVVSWEGK